MHSHNGKRKDSKSFKRLIRSTYACIAIVFISSCAHQTSNLKEKEILDSICLSGSGKGRIEYFQGKQLFDYQSRFDRRKKTWLIGFNLPVIGQEILRFLYEDNKTAGTFANRLNIEIKEKQQKEELNDFFGEINTLLSSVDRQSFESTKWRVSKLKNGAPGYLISNGSTTLKVFSYSIKDKKFHRMTFNYLNDGQKAFVLNLFSNTCTL